MSLTVSVNLTPKLVLVIADGFCRRGPGDWVHGGSLRLKWGNFP